MVELFLGLILEQQLGKIQKNLNTKMPTDNYFI